LINIASADAGIACWDAKYFYNFWRPTVKEMSTDLDTAEDLHRARQEYESLPESLQSWYHEMVGTIFSDEDKS
jgi:hypothetical protein